MKRAAIGLLALALAGCGTSATVTTPGAVWTGTITGHTRDRLIVGGHAVARSDVTDIDHPGNVAAWIGTVVAAVGALSATSNCTAERRAQDETPCQSSGVWLLTGIPIAVYGILTHSASVERAGD